MRSIRFSIGALAMLVVVLALDLAVIRSLVRPSSPGSNQMLYLVPITSTSTLAFLAFALGVLPMASVLVPATLSQAWTIRRRGTVSPFGFGFVAFGWVAVFLFMAIAAVSPPAINEYFSWSASRLGPAVAAVIGNDGPSWLETTFEVTVILVDLTLPELLIALAGGWLVGRSGGRPAIPTPEAGTSAA